MVKGKNHRVRLPFSTEITYIVLKVDGHRMDEAGIDTGDFLILRARPVGLLLTPEDGEIVAVALPGVTQEPFVTLKRYRKDQRGEYHFEPVSSNPNHKAYHFVAAIGIPPGIIGILVATPKLL